MIISNIIGGLGNQMFQFACGMSLALQKRTSFKVAIDSYESYSLHQGYELPRVFLVEPEVATHDDLIHVISWRRSPRARRALAKMRLKLLSGPHFVAEPGYRYWPALLQVPADAYLHGYWQSDRYFDSCESQVRQSFRFRQRLAGENQLWADRITNSLSISLHVRRGDYLSNPRNRALYAPCTPEYYVSAIERVRSSHPDAHFFAFSDDPQWVHDTLGSRFGRVWVVTNNRGTDSHNDMHLMSLCRHHIIANSTFSWWGAWLGSAPDKQVIAPRAWLSGSRVWPEITPEAWIRL